MNIVGVEFQAMHRSRLPRERERVNLKLGISLWHIDKHGVLLTAREREI